jgi:hypothetical protein
MNVSGTKGDDKIPLSKGGRGSTSSFNHRGSARHSLVAFGTGGLYNAPFIDSRNRDLTGRIDWGDKDKVGISKGTSEFPR